MKHWMLANTMIAVIAIAMAASALAGDTEAQTGPADTKAEATATATPTPAPESKDYDCEATLGSRTVWSTETAVSDGHARAAMRTDLATDLGFRDNAVITCADSDLGLVSKRRGDLALGDRMTRNEDALYALETDVDALEDGGGLTRSEVIDVVQEDIGHHESQRHGRKCLRIAGLYGGCHSH